MGENELGKRCGWLESHSSTSLGPRVHPFIQQWKVELFPPLAVKYKIFFSGLRFSFLLDIYLGVHLLGQGNTLIFEDMPDWFPK